MEFKSTRKGNSVYDEMKERLYFQNITDMNRAYETKSGDELIKELGLIESNYVFNLFKLDEISFLQHKSEEIKKRFCNQKLYIDSLDISEKEKIDLILTTTCLFTRIYAQIKHLNEETLYLLGLSMINVRLEEYSIYGKVLADPKIFKEVCDNETLELTEEAFTLCDECNGCELSNPTYQKAMKFVFPVVKKQQIVK